MKIYFEDGVLDKCSKLYEYDGDKDRLQLESITHIVDARFGCKISLDELLSIKNRYRGASVYTNFPIALHDSFTWNKNSKVSEIYIRNEEGYFERIDKLDNRKLKQECSTVRAHVSGEFEQ